MAYVSDAHIVSDIYFFIDISGPMRKKVEQGMRDIDGFDRETNIFIET